MRSTHGSLALIIGRISQWSVFQNKERCQQANNSRDVLP